MNNLFYLLFREFECSDLQSDLARDLSAQGGDGFSPSQSTSTPRSRLLNRRTANPDATQGHQPKQKRKYVPHLSWQYRAVIKSNVSVYLTRLLRTRLAYLQSHSALDQTKHKHVFYYTLLYYLDNR
mgnify:CR=1 FL=1